MFPRGVGRRCRLIWSGDDWVSEGWKGGREGTNRRKKPLISWKVDPVIPNLSKYQWMLRKLEDRQSSDLRFSSIS